MMVSPPSAGRLVLDWAVDPAAALALVVAATLYGLGVVNLGRRQRHWPAGRSAAFGGAILLLVAATQSGLARYDTVLFSAHVVQHMLLGMAAPLLLALGAPVTLALQATAGTTRQVLLRSVHGPVAFWLTHPGVAVGLAGGSLFALYLTPLFRLSLTNEVVHDAVHLHFLVSGCAFFWPVLGVDAGRRRLPHGARMLLVLLLLPLHAVLGLAVLSSRQLLADGWYAGVSGASMSSAMADQQVAGGLLWVAGDLVGVFASGLVLAQWMRHDEREALREDRRLDALPANRS